MEVIGLILNISCVVILVGIVVYWIAAPIISAPFHPSSSKDILEMFELASLDRTDKFVDLGSGDGRAVLAASRVCEEAVGIEHNPFLTLISRFIAIVSSNGKLKFKHKSFWKENLAPYDVIFVYLLPSEMAKLKEKFAHECKTGTRIVTNRFRIKGWKEETSIDGKYHLYVVGKSNT